MRKARLLALAAVAALWASAAAAQMKLPAVFSDHMVLQRGIKVPVWGTGQPGDRIVVSLAGKPVNAVADRTGRWVAWLGPLPAGGPHELTVNGPLGSATIHDILVGDVWVCSGQSNMEMGIAGVNNGADEIAQAQYPGIRLFTVTKAVAPAPAADVIGSWSRCSPETVGAGGWGGFSAVAYFFGRELHKKLGVPIGLIHTSWGGTPAESWTPLKWLQGDPVLTPMLARIPKPGAPEKDWNAWSPTGLYNAMIAPLVPYGIRGAIWYQGESNAGRAYQYRTLFPAMIRSWREAWGEGNFPFFFVQLANFTPQLPNPGDSDWAELREAQTMTLSLPKTGMACIIDIGDAKDIHPKNKQDVGKRLALAAMRVAYGDRGVAFSGPMYKAMQVRGRKAVVSFNYADGLKTADGASVKGFAIAGPDHKFVWADARIAGKTVEVSSPLVSEPVAVRYAWANNPECNLTNAAGLPAVPFRTDDWPGVTASNR